MPRKCITKQMTDTISYPWRIPEATIQRELIHRTSQIEDELPGIILLGSMHARSRCPQEDRRARIQNSILLSRVERHRLALL